MGEASERAETTDAGWSLRAGSADSLSYSNRSRETVIVTDYVSKEQGSEPPGVGPIWNRATLDGLRAVLGDEKVDGILSGFWRDVCQRFGNRDDAELLCRDAHVVKSTAGLLGFDRLGEAALSLEAACLESRPFKALVEDLDGRRKEVGEVVVRWLGESGQVR